MVSIRSWAQVHFFLCGDIQFDCFLFIVKNDLLQLHCFQIISLSSLVKLFVFILDLCFYFLPKSIRFIQSSTL